MATSGLSGEHSQSRVRELALAAGIGLAGYLTTQLGAATIGSIIGLVTISAFQLEGTLGAYPGIVVGFGAGALIFVALYFALSRHDWSYIDLRWPSTRDLAYTVGALGLLIVALIGISQLFELLGVAPSTHGIEQDAREGDPTVLLFLIPLTILVIGPAEELVFRNIVQKRLGESISMWGAITVTSVIFAVVHFGAYATSESLAEIGGSLGVVFLLSIVLGWSYAKTQNILVPSIAHGVYNALQFGVLYLTIA